MITRRLIRPVRRRLENTRRAISRDTTSDAVTHANSSPTHSRDSSSYCARNETATRNPALITPAISRCRSSSPNRLIARARKRWLAPIISTHTGTMTTVSNSSSLRMSDGTGLKICWPASARNAPTMIATMSEAINRRRKRCGFGRAAVTRAASTDESSDASPSVGAGPGVACIRDAGALRCPFDRSPPARVDAVVLARCSCPPISPPSIFFVRHGTHYVTTTLCGERNRQSWLTFS